MRNSSGVAVHADLDGFAAIQVVLREREARDRWWWDYMLACYREDSFVSLSWHQGPGFDFVAQSKDLSESVPSRHRLGPPTVRAAHDRAVVALPAAVETYPTVDGVGCVLIAHCRLLYRLQKTGGDWKIARLDAVYERDTLLPGIPGGVINLDPAELADLRVPYRMLAWTTARSGYPVSQDLPADDRPDQVAVLYAAAYTWADIPHP